MMTAIDVTMTMTAMMRLLAGGRGADQSRTYICMQSSASKLN
jgi:hypothetical protein